MKAESKLSLNTKLLIVQLASLCLALVVFLSCMLLGRHLLNNLYLAPEACLKREQEYVRDLSAYIEENSLSSSDADALTQWARKQKYVYLSVYKGESPILETDGYDTEMLGGSEETAPVSLASLDDSHLLEKSEDGYYKMQFSDGMFRVNITEFSETPYYDLLILVSLTAACLAMLGMNIHYNSSVTGAIIRLNREVQQVAQGNKNLELSSKRPDEIGDLARAVESMRTSIIEQMKKEQDAWQANTGLITAISHDIRTPLTALIGYLDLLQGGQYRNEEQMASYLNISQKKAIQLKELTDELFRYFLVFGQPEVKMQMERYNAVILLEQLLGDLVIRLRDAGFTVNTVTLQQECDVMVDVQYLQRVRDNLCSNVLKHADPAAPVIVMARREGGSLYVDVSNGVPPRSNAVESTQIGLQTCRKVISQMGGTFETSKADGRFLAEVSLPVLEALEETK